MIVDADADWVALVWGPDQGGPVWIDFADPAAYRKMWVMVLTMAVRDRAISVGYSPGFYSGTLWYVADGTHYQLVPPPDDYGVVAAARALVMPGRWAALRWRLDGLFGSRAAAAMFGFSIGGNVSWWVGKVWQADGWQGVDFRRIDAVPARDVAEPPWWD